MFGEKLDSLLKLLSPAHNIVLNDKNLTIVKLHNNRKFYEWLATNNIKLSIKPYHSANNTRTYGIAARSSGDLYPMYITLALIPPGINEQINISCCNVIINKTAHNIFENKTGVIFNGSYFYLQRHITEQVYNIKLDTDINGNVSSRDNTIVSYLEKPIGIFKYNSTREGGPAKNNYKLKTYSRIYDGKSLENTENVRENDRTEQYGIYTIGETTLTLHALSDTLGLVMFPKTGGMNIKKLLDVVEYNGKTPMINQTTDDNIAMGNLLVYNNEVILNEEKMACAILLFPIYELGYKKYDKIYLCNDNFEKLKGIEVNTTQLDKEVCFISYTEPTNPTKRGKIIFNSNNIYLPFSIDFIKKSNPNDFAGKIPPGFPNHASDLNPRTCIMQDVHNNIIVTHVEGRGGVCGGIGIDLFDLATLCKGLGAVNALNLDGGQSSKMSWREEGNIIQTVGVDDYKIGNAIFLA